MAATNILLLFLGWILQVLVTVQKVIKDKKNVFSLPYWIQKNWLNGVISLIAAFTGLILGKDLMFSMGAIAVDGSPMYLIHAFLCGYLGREIIFRVLDLLKKK